MQGNLIVVAAPSGAGKTSLIAALIAGDAQVRLAISYTTRPPRAGEEIGSKYRFVTRAEFEKLRARGEFLESAEVHGHLYGTSRAWINEAIKTGCDILLEIDWQGARQIEKLYPDRVAVFVLPPSIGDLERRLRARGLDDSDTIRGRLEAAREEMAHVDEFDYVIINDKFDEAVKDLTCIVRSRRLTLGQQRVRRRELLKALK